ncbi:tetratricopeptide repeat protein [Fodinicola feengrottensis]|uniref:tetratricopeptide repeat protein n=1 Tax=Fodinicola feengrottensis TaxID=435914 RepID=UPI0024415B5F|nr:tetratricopeptide repeat protein [Fodinicola feengrottensis]
MEAAFALSYEQLSMDQRRFFRLLGVFPGLEIDAYAAAALADLTPRTAEDLLERLFDVHLIEQPRQGRYRFHALVRRHAVTTAAAQDPSAERTAALRRIVDYYLQAADFAATVVEPGRRQFAPLNRSATLPEMPDSSDWLETERSNLTTAVSVAAERGWHSTTWRLAQCLWRHFLTRGHLLDWLETHEKALTSAREIHDRVAEAETLKNLGVAYLRLGRFHDGVEVHYQALDLDRKSKDLLGEAKTHNKQLGFVLSSAGSHADALTHHRRSADLYRTIADLSGESRALVGLGDGHFWAPAGSTRHCRNSSGPSRSRTGPAMPGVRHSAWLAAASRSSTWDGLPKQRNTSDRPWKWCWLAPTAVASRSPLVGLGLVHLRSGRRDEARTTLQAGLSLADETGELWGAETARKAMHDLVCYGIHL